MKIWLITDTHLGHDKMVEFCGRPKNHSELILRNLYAIPKEDLLIHLGDVNIGQNEYWHNCLMNIPKKILVMGNHDRQSHHWYYEHGWNFVCDQFISLEFGKRILFSHYPIKDDGQYDINIHGHFHNSEHRSHEPELVAIKNDKQKLLAIENTNYQPVLLRTFLGL